MKSLRILIPFLLTACQFKNSDKQLRSHSLVGTRIELPDYTLVVEDKGNTLSLSPKMVEINAFLNTLDYSLSFHGNSGDGLSAKRVLKPATFLTVEKVYRSTPSFPRSMFSDGYDFAVLGDGEGVRYTSLLDSSASVSLELNGCHYPKCKMWKKLFDETSRKSKIGIQIEYRIVTEEGVVKADESKPPYKSDLLQSSSLNLINFIKERNLSLIEQSSSHPLVTIYVDQVQLGNLLLLREKLGISKINSLR